MLYVHIIVEKSFLLCFVLPISFKQSSILKYIIFKGKQGRVMINRVLNFSKNILKWGRGVIIK